MALLREPRSKMRHQTFHPFPFGPRFHSDPLIGGIPFKLGELSIFIWYCCAPWQRHQPWSDANLQLKKQWLLALHVKLEKFKFLWKHSTLSWRKEIFRIDFFFRAIRMSWRKVKKKQTGEVENIKMRRRGCSEIEKNFTSFVASLWHHNLLSICPSHSSSCHPRHSRRFHAVVVSGEILLRRRQLLFAQHVCVHQKSAGRRKLIFIHDSTTTKTWCEKTTSRWKVIRQRYDDDTSLYTFTTPPNHVHRIENCLSLVNRHVVRSVVLAVVCGKNRLFTILITCVHCSIARLTLWKLLPASFGNGGKRTNFDFHTLISCCTRQLTNCRTAVSSHNDAVKLNEETVEVNLKC